MKKLLLLLPLTMSQCLIGAAFAYPTQTTPLEAKQDKGYIVWENKEQGIKYWLDGRIMFDTGFVSGLDSEEGYSEDFVDNTITRRARFSVKSKISQYWSGEWDIDVGSNDVSVKDLWFAYSGIDHTSIKFGNHKVPSMMEEVTTSRWTTFLERAMMTNFSVGRKIGISANHWNENYMVHGGYYFAEMGDDSDDGDERVSREQTGFAVRSVYRPMVDSDTVFHVGASYQVFQPNVSYDDGDENRYLFSAKPESNIPFKTLLNTGQIEAVDNYSTLGLEAAFKQGPLSAQAEWVQAKLSRTESGLGEASFNGYYAYVSYFLTADQRTYDKIQSEFGPVFPNSDKGAMEIAFRISNLDLNDNGAIEDIGGDPDETIQGGAADTMTFAFNWYANDNVAIKLNYIMVDPDENTETEGDDFDMLLARFQYLF